MIELPVDGWKNKKGTKDRIPAGYKSWLDYYQRLTNKTDLTCSVAGCNNKATDGAHVYNTKTHSKAKYIVPLCHSCNMSQSELSLKQGIPLVSANQQNNL